jgi:hypothetical protein
LKKWEGITFYEMMKIYDDNKERGYFITRMIKLKNRNEYDENKNV